MEDKTTTAINKDSKDSTLLLILIMLASLIVFQGLILWRIMALESKVSNLTAFNLQANADTSITAPDNNTVVQEVSMGFNAPRGDTKAPVVIVEFSNFSCPYCSESAQILRELIKSNPGKIRLYYRHFIPPSNTDAFRAALAVECAGKQGHFWEMHDALFEPAPNFSENRLSNIIKSINIKETDFSTCLSTEEFKVRIQDDIAEAQKLGVTGTPTFFINGRISVGSRSMGDWKTLLELP